MKPNYADVLSDHPIFDFKIVAFVYPLRALGHHSLAVILMNVLRQEVWFVPLLDWVAQNRHGLFADKREARAGKVGFPWKNMRHVQQELKALGFLSASFASLSAIRNVFMGYQDTRGSG